MSTRRGIRRRAIGAGDTFAAPPAPSTSCPPGFHWEVDEVPIRGISACVPDKVATLRLHGNAAAAPPPAAPVMYTPPATTDAAAAPPASVMLPQSATCPAPWSLWWLLVAAAAGAGAGIYFAAEEKKKRRPNGRIAP